MPRTEIPGVGWFAYFTDLSGNKVALLEPLENMEIREINRAPNRHKVGGLWGSGDPLVYVTGRKHRSL